MEQVQRRSPIVDQKVGHGALAGLGRRGPVLVAHAAHAVALHHELVVPVGEVVARLVASDGTTQHRVVPVHGPTVLGGERPVGPGPDHMGQVAQRKLPVGSLVAQFLSQRHRTAQAVADAGRPGQQGKRPRGAVRVACPQDFAPRRL